MSVQTNCPQCGANFKVKDRYAGQRGTCPRCGAMVVVPVDAESEKKERPALTGSSLSLQTHVPMLACPLCGKNNLLGSPSCFHCEALLPAPE